MPVSALHAITGGKRRFAFIAFPNLLVARLARFPTQWMFLQDIAFIIAIQLDEPRLLARIQPIGQDDQNLSLSRFRHKTG